jgi:hypothetical protein
MTPEPRPQDRPALSEEDRAWLELQARTGRPPDLSTPPSRSRFGRVLDFFDNLARGSRGNHWR